MAAGPTQIIREQCPLATCDNDGLMSADQACKLDSAVTAVTGTAPITSTGGTTPDIGITPATDVAAGSMSAADKAKLDSIGGGGILFYGSRRIGAFLASRFLTPGFGTTPIAPIAEMAMAAPRAGVLKNLIVRHNRAAGNGNSVIYTVWVNGAPTAISVPVATGSILEVLDSVNSVVVAQGDTISIQAVKPAPIGSGFLNIEASIEV